MIYYEKIGWITSKGNKVQQKLANIFWWRKIQNTGGTVSQICLMRHVIAIYKSSKNCHQRFKCKVFTSDSFSHQNVFKRIVCYNMYLPGLQMAVILRVGRGRMWIFVTRFPWRPRVHHGCCRSCLLTVHHVSHSGRVGAWIATWACKIGPCIYNHHWRSSKRER